MLIRNAYLILFYSCLDHTTPEKTGGNYVWVASLLGIVFFCVAVYVIRTLIKEKLKKKSVIQPSLHTIINETEEDMELKLYEYRQRQQKAWYIKNPPRPPSVILQVHGLSSDKTYPSVVDALQPGYIVP